VLLIAQPSISLELNKRIEALKAQSTDYIPDH
jgi:hypothetical protein